MTRAKCHQQPECSIQLKAHLDLGQVQKVLGDVDGDLVEESWGDVEAILNVVQVPGSRGQVVLAGEDGIVGASLHHTALVQGVDLVTTTRDVLLHKTQRLSVLCDMSIKIVHVGLKLSFWPA